MILIADAGGTSIKWRMIAADGDIRQAVTEGYNAYAHKVDKFRNSLQHMVKQLNPVNLDKVFFYGAGISSALNKQLVLTELEHLVKSNHYEINHDLLACARSLLGDQPGIACILGTGSNSCYYDGVEIIENKPSLGYIIGDEGSGNALGKELLRLYFRDSLPEDLHTKFEKRYPITTDELLIRVYTDREGPDFLAGFTKFLFDHMRHPFVYQIIYKEFDKFFSNVISQYKNADHSVINFSGSIAFYYANILRQVGNDKGYTVKTIVEDPIAGLSLYHQNKDL